MNLPSRCLIGLVADTHLPGAALPMWDQLRAAFAGVDAIVHAGDLHVSAVLDELETLAPVVAARGNGDHSVEHAALRDAWLLHTPLLTIGVVHEFPSPRHASDAKLERYRARHFGTHDPGVIIYGHTHHDELHHTGGRLYVNPGSPTLPRNQSVRLGTLALLRLDGAHAEVTLLQLTKDGATTAGTLTNTAA